MAVQGGHAAAPARDRFTMPSGEDCQLFLRGCSTCSTPGVTKRDAFSLHLSCWKNRTSSSPHVSAIDASAASGSQAPTPTNPRPASGSTCSMGIPPTRNTSDTCWIFCFYATVLGKETLLPGDHSAGMPLAQLSAAFARPFLPEAQGGCPAVPVPAAPAPSPRAPSRYARQRAAVLRALYEEAAELAAARRAVATVEAV